jgi:hypothetical protein
LPFSANRRRLTFTALKDHQRHALPLAPNETNARP